MIKRNININDITIYDIDDKFGVSGYNIGDLLNMPYYFAGWNQNPHDHDNYLNIAIETANNNPSTILGIYYKNRPLDEKIPNLNRLNQSIFDYINQNNINNLDIYKMVQDDDVLCVHIRSGDVGIISQLFIDTIAKLSHKFKKVLLIMRNINTTIKSLE